MLKKALQKSDPEDTLDQKIQKVLSEFNPEKKQITNLDPKVKLQIVFKIIKNHQKEPIYEQNLIIKPNEVNHNSYVNNHQVNISTQIQSNKNNIDLSDPTPDKLNSFSVLNNFILGNHLYFVKRSMIV